MYVLGERLLEATMLHCGPLESNLMFVDVTEDEVQTRKN